jgi:hypothetical protein
LKLYSRPRIELAAEGHLQTGIFLYSETKFRTLLFKLASNMSSTQNYFRKREREIRRMIDDAFDAFEEYDEDEDAYESRQKSTKLLPLIPYDRPINRLKQLTYRLAVEVRDKNRIDGLIDYVKERDKAFQTYRDAQVTEWALRLAVVKPPPTRKWKRADVDTEKKSAPNKYSRYLIRPSQISKFGRELELAYSLDIDWRNLTMFISAIGGYEYIHGNRVPPNLESKKWVQGLMRRKDGKDAPVSAPDKSA